jgi:hypothetical protein
MVLNVRTVDNHEIVILRCAVDHGNLSRTTLAHEL